MSSIPKSSGSHRVVCLERLSRTIQAPWHWQFGWHLVLMRRLCLVLFELPLHVQVGLAVATAERYLPAYERKHPHLSQMRQFFVRCLTADPPTDLDVDDWYGTLSNEDRGDLADRALFGAAELAAQATREATREFSEPPSVTSACLLSVVYAIGAGEKEAWMAVDPEAAAARLADLQSFNDDEEQEPPRQFDPLKYRYPWLYPEVRNAALAGWDSVVAWLRAADVGQYPDYVERKMLAWMLRELRKLPRVIHFPYLDMELPAAT